MVVDTPNPLILLVDDDPLISDALAFALGRQFTVVTSHSRGHCRQVLAQLKQPPALAIIDLGLPPTPHRPDEGFALIAELLAAQPGLRIIVLSGQNDEDHARHARTLGALDFVGKPCDPGELLVLIQRTLALPPLTGLDDPACALLGESLPMQRLRQQIAQVADSPYPVLIEGESGSGKDIVASCYLHRRAARGNRPFLALNCAAIAPSLVEPMLFGHAKGAFTGAIGAQPGYFEEAGEGTLFLDEIGELPLELQPKLLRVLENGEYQRVGETQTRRSKARILAATNRDLKKEVKAGRFRADLYHRLSVFTLSVPPLRELGDDRLRLLEHYRSLFSRQVGVAPFVLASAAEALWQRYAFPGNVRELRNIALRLTAKYSGQPVSAGELAAELDDDEEAAAATTPLATGNLATMTESAGDHLRELGNIDLDAALAQWERAYIEAALRLAGGNVSQAARRLGLNRTTLYNRMEGWSRS